MIAINKNIWTKLLIMSLLFAFSSSEQAIAEDKETPAHSALFELPIEELMDVNVTTASKKSESIYDAPAVMNIVPRDEIEIYGDRTLFDTLQRQPSIFTEHSYAFGDNIASFRGDLSTHQERHTLVLFNGRPIRESALGYDFPIYMAFPLSTISSVEIVRGPGSVLYGTNAFTGVVNMKTEVPDHNELSISGTGGSYDYFESDVTARGRSGELGYVAAGRVVDNDGFPMRMADGSGITKEENSYDRSVSGAAHLDYRDLTFDIFGADIDMFNMGEMLDWGVPHDSRTQRLFTNLGYRIPMGDETTLELNGTYNLQEDHHAVMQEPKMVGTNTSDILGEATLYTKPLDNMNVVLGFLQQHLSNFHPSDKYFQSIKSYSYDPMSIYGQADYKINSFIKLIAGAQWNESPLGDSDIVSRYGVVITPLEHWGVKLLRGEAFRGPMAVESDLYHPPLSPSAIFTFTGNKDLKPETITTYDAQLFYHDDKTYAAITYFHSKTDGMIVYDFEGLTVSYKNGGTQTFDSIELEAKHFLTPHWNVMGSYMYQDNVSDAGIFPSSAPHTMGKLGTGYAWDGGSASIFYTRFGKQEENLASYTIARNPKPEAINLITLNIQLDISKWIGMKKGQSVFTFRVENLLDEKDWTTIYGSDSYPYGPGRTYFFGLRMTF